MKIWVSAKVVPHWIMFRKTVYYVNTEFGALGPYATVYEALEQLNFVRRAVGEDACSGSSC